MASRFTAKQERLLVENVVNAVRGLPIGESTDIATPLSKRKVVNNLLAAVKGADGEYHWYHCDAIPNGVRVTRRAGIGVCLVNIAE